MSLFQSLVLSPWNSSPAPTSTSPAGNQEGFEPSVKQLVKFSFSVCWEGSGWWWEDTSEALPEWMDNIWLNKYNIVPANIRVWIDICIGNSSQGYLKYCGMRKYAQNIEGFFWFYWAKSFLRWDKNENKNKERDFFMMEKFSKRLYCSRHRFSRGTSDYDSWPEFRFVSDAELWGAELSGTLRKTSCWHMCQTLDFQLWPPCFGSSSSSRVTEGHWRSL